MGGMIAATVLAVFFVPVFFVVVRGFFKGRPARQAVPQPAPAQGGQAQGAQAQVAQAPPAEPAGSQGPAP